MKSTRCILSCDGGGIRGLITAILLARLEAKLQEHNNKKKLRDYFDLIAGTSTGSLIACGVSIGLSASEIKQMYCTKGIVIFPKFNWVAWSLLLRVRPGYSQPIYDDKGLEKVLKEVFGDKPFLTLPVPTLVTSYDTYNRQAVVMQSNQPTFEDIPIWEVCRASAAAPIAFPGHLMRDLKFIAFLEKSGYSVPTDRFGKKAVPLIDGGVFANNPALCAVVERLDWSDRPVANDLLIASFGTGHNIKEIELEAAREWGVLEWFSPRRGIPILDTLFDGSSDAVDYTVQGLSMKHNYYRFQPRLEANVPAFDAGRANLERLEAAANKYLSKPDIEQKLNTLVEQLRLRQPA